jgi:hypothetical protein
MKHFKNKSTRSRRLSEFEFDESLHFTFALVLKKSIENCEVTRAVEDSAQFLQSKVICALIGVGLEVALLTDTELSQKREYICVLLKMASEEVLIKQHELDKVGYEYQVLLVIINSTGCTLSSLWRNIWFGEQF